YARRTRGAGGRRSPARRLKVKSSPRGDLARPGQHLRSGRRFFRAIAHELQAACPGIGRVEDIAHRFGFVTVLLEAAVLELHARALTALGDEANFDLGAKIRVVTPLGVELPDQNKAVRLLPHENASQSHSLP